MGVYPHLIKALAQDRSLDSQSNRPCLDIKIDIKLSLMGTGIVYHRPKMAYGENETKAPATV